jgi:protoheme IX farnesyltransferase
MRHYINLIKPGIIAGNLVTAMGGYLLASKGLIDPKSFLAMILGLITIIASACVFNNLSDKDIDAKMTRTRQRALVMGTVTSQKALVFASALFTTSVTSLWMFTNALTLLWAVLGFIAYVLVYTPIKKISSHGTLVGSISGAIPPVCGYLAAKNSLDLGAVILFFMVTFWQMPHFYAIAMYRQNEYKAAGIPVLPLVKGTLATKVQMTLYSALFALTCTLPSFFGYTGQKYLVVSMILGASWLGYSALGFTSRCDIKWAKMMFRMSLLVITLLSVMMSIDAL